MIRFINLTGQILIDDTEPHFAWYDTIHSKFLEFNEGQDWHNWSDFHEDLLAHCFTKSMIPADTAQLILRLEKLYQFDDIVRTESKVTKTADFDKGVSSTMVEDDFYGKDKKT